LVSLVYLVFLAYVRIVLFTHAPFVGGETKETRKTK